MVKLEQYKNPLLDSQVYKLEISNYELSQLVLTPNEVKILQQLGADDAPISNMLAGLALLARKIEQYYTQPNKQNVPNC